MKCGIEGHLAEDCRVFKPGTCRNCGKDGHKTRACPRLNLRKSMPNTAEDWLKSFEERKGERLKKKKKKVFRASGSSRPSRVNGEQLEPWKGKARAKGKGKVPTTNNSSGPHAKGDISQRTGWVALRADTRLLKIDARGNSTTSEPCGWGGGGGGARPRF